jgi:hypothetical protein
VPGARLARAIFAAVEAKLIVTMILPAVAAGELRRGRSPHLVRA